MALVTEPVVSTTSGQVRGHTAGGVTRFRAVPYAAAPTGPLRFAPPQPAPAWKGIREAIESGPTAPQNPSRFQSEQLDFGMLAGGWRPGADYLTAEVCTPDTGAGGLPVLVFLHGGAFIAGAGNQPLYDGAAFARGGAVYFAINYRLGVEGFLTLPGVTNLGLRDQIAALEWVRDNAAAFGGDPGNVTVFGESAGGMSVATLLATPAASGLFHRAIVQSGHGELLRSLPVSARLTAHVAEQAGVPTTAEAFREVPVQRLLQVQEPLTLPGHGVDLREADGLDPAAGMAALLPVHGDDLVPVPPHQALAAGAGAEVDLLVGSNTEEARLYFVPSGMLPVITEELALAMLAASHPDPAGLLAAHGLGSVAAGEAFTAALTDLVFRDGAARLAAAHTGRTATYEFAWRSPACGGQLGACHGLELPFVFDNLALGTGPKGFLGEQPPQELAREMNSAWLRFAATGDPGWTHRRFGG